MRGTYICETECCSTSDGKAQIQVCDITAGGSIQAWCYGCRQIVYPALFTITGAARELADALIAEQRS